MNGVHTDRPQALNDGGAVAAALYGRPITFGCACRLPGFACVTGIPLRVSVNVPHCNLGHPIVPAWLAESMAA